MNSSLSTSLFRELRPNFFGVLASPSARLYVDALDALEREAVQRNQGLDREEALALVEQVVEIHADLAGKDSALAAVSTMREKARTVLDVLRQAGWVEEDSRTDYRRIIYFDANGVILLQALRKIAFPDAEVFSDKIVNVCTTLMSHDALAEQPWAQVESCVASLKVGLAELRSMENLIKRHTRQQLAANTLKENLSLLFDQFAERIARTCYAQLIHARLPSRLAEARRAIDEQLEGADLQIKMQTEVMRRDTALSPEAAMAHVRLRVAELGELLNQVEPLADSIDRKTAEFTRRSQARFRYLQETTSDNRARLHNFFETLNRHFAGQRLSDIETLGVEFPGPQLHDVRILGGLESLYSPRLRRSTGEIEPLEETEERQGDRALAELEGTMRDSLTISRANRFIANLPGGQGAQINSADLLREFVHNDEDVGDLIACLLHARSSDAKFQIDVPRVTADEDDSEFNEKLGYRIERFTVVKK
jgi:hypothetical protein